MVERYGERHRAYHNLNHVLDCLDRAAAVRSRLVAPGPVELALWYHDAIYDPYRSDNEERSAALAVEESTELAFPQPVIDAVASLILATKHQGRPVDADCRYLVDIDLAILAAPEAAYDAYERAIRREYRWVPGPLYRSKRREVLRSFLERERIYATDWFAGRFEAAARANLAKAVSELA
ncbi:MAG TPA: N-methyl-D-aspartate receptor NMDAR2C subunit [Thermoanaerobaculia bacterium]|nr:N-methyl-D-aspartate receptor NMDAR2C subunit [Thermoanaerobaculia bacterium]